jgi:hypothetical protein
MDPSYILVERVPTNIGDHAPDKAFIGLFAAEGTMPFYQRYGFQQSPALTDMFALTPLATLPKLDAS